MLTIVLTYWQIGSHYAYERKIRISETSHGRSEAKSAPETQDKPPVLPLETMLTRLPCLGHPRIRSLGELCQGG